MKELASEIESIVRALFKGDEIKMRIWFETPNPMLGGLAPQVMMCPESIEKLHSFVKDAEATNQLADDRDHVMIAATAVSGDADLAEQWFRNHPIDAFRGKTANQLVLEVARTTFCVISRCSKRDPLGDPMIFIALDIDGVLHSVDARTDADDPELKPFTYLHRFETVLRDYPDVRVVIASDWQKHHTLEELRALFSEDLRARIVGVTGRDLGDTQPGNRQRDVERYLTEQGLAEATWCAIDDDEQNYLPTTALVHCQNDGFREADERALRAVLSQLQESIPSPLLARATKALGSPEAAARWFAAPQLALNKQRPLDLLATADGATLVEDALVRIEYGVYT